MTRQPRPAGWAEVQPIARAGMAPENMVMIYGPHGEHEADIILGFLPKKEVASEEQ